MRFSVIVNTLNRATCLRVLLQSLEYQTYPDFEVVVVNGPSTDDTADVLAQYAGRIRTAVCPKANLSLSRNIGIAAAAGDACAFIDDDGVPEPQWLADLAAGYDRPAVAGVGGIVYDHTGYELEYSCVVCDRLARAVKHVRPPLTPYQLPKADPYLHLMGGNSSFRREKLREVGGFDEEIEYFLDEAELCLQMNNRGFLLVQSDRGVMLHKAAPSHVRTSQRIIRRPYPIVKNKYYFVLQAARRGEVELADAMAEAVAWSDKFRRDGQHLRNAGVFTAAEHEQYERDIEAAVRVGTEQGMRGERKSGDIPPVDAAAFRPFPTRQPAGRRLTVCFVSKDLPPEVTGGVGRYTRDLAWGLGDDGHEVHVVTRSPAHPTVDFEDGVWVHRVPPMADGPWAEGAGPEVRGCLAWAAAAHAEVRRLSATRPVDVVSCPSWDSEGVFCLLDDELPGVLTVVTTAQTVADTDPLFRGLAAAQSLIDLERLTVRAARLVVVPSQHMLAKVKKDFGPTPGVDGAVVLPLGTADRPVRRKKAGRRPTVPIAVEEYEEDDAPPRVRVLTVGRLEGRKGTDLFLAAAAVLCPEFPDAEFVLVGDADRPMDRSGLTYRQAFARDHGHRPWADRVLFRGAVTDAQLTAEYAACDMFCLPARFESFGLVLTEAMMHGKPTVAAAVGGMTDIVDDGRTGLLVYPGSAASLAAALRGLLADPDLRARMGRAGRARYEERFAGRVVVSRTADLFDRLSGGGRAAA